MCRERTHSLTRFLCLASVRKEREDQEEEQRKRRLAAAEAEEKARRKGDSAHVSLFALCRCDKALLLALFIDSHLVCL